MLSSTLPFFEGACDSRTPVPGVGGEGRLGTSWAASLGRPEESRGIPELADVEGPVLLFFSATDAAGVDGSNDRDASVGWGNELSGRS